MDIDWLETEISDAALRDLLKWRGISVTDEDLKPVQDLVASVRAQLRSVARALADFPPSSSEGGAPSVD